MTHADAAPGDDLIRLRMLLGHMIDHNDDHAGEIQAYGDALKRSFDPAAVALLEHAVRDMGVANRSLSTLLGALGGPVTR